MVTPSKPLRAPVERREAVVDRVARLDQASGRRDGEERRLAQMAVRRRARVARRPRRAAAARAGTSRPRRAQLPAKISQIRLPARAGRAAPAGEVRRDEGDRAPQPHRPVGAAAQAQALERIGVDQRQQRRRRRAPAGSTAARIAGKPLDAAEQRDRADGRERGDDDRAVAASRGGRRAACRPASPTMRTSWNAASTKPIAAGSSPRAASQTGKNGKYQPVVTKNAA